MTNTTETINTHTPVRTLVRAAIAALVAALALTVLSPTAAHAAGETASVSPSTAPAGAPVTISGSGFQPGEAVEVWYGGPTIASGVADGNGDFSVSGNIPAGMPEGGHPLDVVGDMGSNVSLNYVVAAPAPPAPAPAPSGSGTPAGPSAKASTPTPKVSTTDTADTADVLSEDIDTASAGTVTDDTSLGTNAAVWLLIVAALAGVGVVICVVAARRDRDEDPII